MTQEQRRPCVLCVDDEPNILKSMQRLLLGEPYDLKTAQSGADALTILAEHPVDLVVSDMRMPHMTGAELMKEVSVRYPTTGRIILTGYADIQSAISAVNDGQVHRYLQKPWNNEELKTAIRDNLDRVQLQRQNATLQSQLKQAYGQVRAINQKLEQAYAQVRAANVQLEQKVHQRTIQLRQTLGQLKDEHSAMYKVLYNVVSISPDLDGGVAQNVSELCRDLAIRLGLEKQQVEDCALAGLLFEIGLLGTPVALYQKPFYQLSTAERSQYYKHPQQAGLILGPAVHLQQVVEYIAHQYERYNGTGVPDKLSAVSIPIGARIVAVARDYWAHQLGRLSKEELTPQKALQQIKLLQGTSYDPDVVRELQKITLHDVMAFIDHSSKALEVKDLVPGMILQQALYNHQKILILPEGHLLTEQTINRLKNMATNSPKPMRVFAINPAASQPMIQQNALDSALGH